MVEKRKKSRSHGVFQWDIEELTFLIFFMLKDVYDKLIMDKIESLLVHYHVILSIYFSIDFFINQIWIVYILLLL